MSLLRWMVLGFLALPAAEIVVFIVIASWIGFTATLLLTLMTSLLGISLIRSAGRVQVAKFRAGLSDGVAGTLETSGDGPFTVLGGILLTIPGFLTDALGAILLVPTLRRRLGGILRRLLPRQGHDRRMGGVVDLDPGEWHRVPERQLDRDRTPDRE